jgi:hypothetical protein
MSVYAEDHASAYADVSADGASAVFTKTVTPQDDTTGAPGTPVTTTWSGVAIERVEGSKREYRDGGLTAVEYLTLFYVPTVIGDIPEQGAAITWKSEGMRVRRRPKEINLDGQGAIAAYVELIRT